MNLDKVVKYSVPLFVLAIVSRSIEEVSFIYYLVPVMSLFFIVLMFISSKSNSLPRTCLTARQAGFGIKGQSYKVDKETSSLQSPESEGTSDVDFRQPAYRTGRAGMTGQAGTTDSEQVGMTDNSSSSFWRSPESERQKRSDSLLATLKRMTPILLFLMPGAWFLLTSLWSSYPDISAARALYFILISLGSISAGILWIRYSDKDIFDLLLPANIIVVLLCLFSIITNIPSDSWTGGHGKGFMGFFGHQNLLASVLLFTLPSVLYRVVILAKSRIQRTGSDSRRTSFAGMTVKSDSSFRRSPESEIPSDYLLLTTNLPTGQAGFLPITAYCLLLTANLLLLILTYSRSAIVALIFGVIIFLILNRNLKLLTYSLGAAALLGLIIYSVPSFNNALDKILKKDFPEVYSSRLWMWEPSYKAAIEGGLFGLGYGISHPDIRSGEYSDRFEDGRIIREKGNSVLALIEEAGVIGLLLFLFPIIYMLAKLKIKNEQLKIDSEHYSLLILNSSLAAMLLHAQFEAWWVGVGSVQLPLFFLYIGLIFNQSTIRSK